MGVFRSEKMFLCQILFSQETVFDCIEILGNLGLVQFRDLNAPVTQYQRRYVGDVRRCEEMERKIRLLEDEIRRSDTPIRECKDIPPAPRAKETLSLETNLESLVADIGNVNKSSNVLKRNLMELIEQYHVVKKASVWLHANQLVFDEEKGEGLCDQESGKGKGIGHLKVTTGVIRLEKVKAFEMLIWRICRGVAFIRIIHITQPLSEPDTDSTARKAVFVIICQGENLNSKILKVCEAFRCNLYLSPASAAHRREVEKKTLTGIRDIQQVMEQTRDYQRRVLLAAATNIEKWKLQVLKLKSIYHVMNMLQLDEINEFQMAECWIPQSDLQNIRSKLNRAVERLSNQNDPIIIVKSHCEDPPTFNRTNKFTKAFQTLIDSYGINDYCEVNPMPFTIVTFPFLFSVMFGDVGHGLILILFSVFMVYYEGRLERKKIRGEIQRIFFEGRYIILLMGLFSCYTGLIYNDFFSKSLKLFPSSWVLHYNMSAMTETKMFQLDPVRDFSGESYLFGIDPIWQYADNKIMFLNSFKMKVSVIFGVLHMFFGMVLSVGNHFYFGQYYNVYTEFVPGMIYFGCLFVYLVFLIMAKWILYGPLKEFTGFGTSCAPNILIVFVNMIMFKHTNNPDECSPHMYPNQDNVQMTLASLAFLSVPWLFAAKTAVLLHHRKSHVHSELPDGIASRDVKAKKFNGSKDGLDSENDDAGDVIIRQAIKTIEFVLGSVSHTASYLRLWALSLAHAQLSDVLWKMVLRFGIASRGNMAGLSISICFAVWATLTVGILVVMEGLSAFLHTLRLHWVEFQSKFYSGSGNAFRPYSFDKIFDLSDDREAIE